MATTAKGVKQGSTKLGYYAAAGGVALIALVFFSIAGYQWLLESFDAPLAAALTGLAVLSIAIVIAVIGHHGWKKPHMHKKSMFSSNDGILESVEHAVKSVMDGVGDPIRENPKMAMLLALLAGVLAGDRINDK